MSLLLAAVLCGAAVQGFLPWAPRADVGGPAGPAPGDDGSDARLRALWSALAGVGLALFVSGRAGLPVGALAAAATWLVLARAEPPAVRRAREAAERDLPGLVHLLAAALESGRATGEAVRLVCDAYPGPAAELVSAVSPRLALGIDVESAWRPVLEDARLAVLGRTMVRAWPTSSAAAPGCGSRNAPDPSG